VASDRTRRDCELRRDLCCRCSLVHEGEHLLLPRREE
jgi:hypothetical protein